MPTSMPDGGRVNDAGSPANNGATADEGPCLDGLRPRRDGGCRRQGWPAACTPDGAIAILGDYTAPDGSERWLRKTATATTYAVVPGGGPDASSLPALYRVAIVCSGTIAGTLSLAGLDGTAARLDWTSANGVTVCFRAAADTTAALALPPPDATNTTTGCSGAAWLALTKETP